MNSSYLYIDINKQCILMKENCLGSFGCGACNIPLLYKEEIQSGKYSGEIKTNWCKRLKKLSKTYFRIELILTIVIITSLLGMSGIFTISDWDNSWAWLMFGLGAFYYGMFLVLHLMLKLDMVKY
jgi:hypothetical protein